MRHLRTILVGLLVRFGYQAASIIPDRQSESARRSRSGSASAVFPTTRRRTRTSKRRSIAILQAKGIGGAIGMRRL